MSVLYPVFVMALLTLLITFRLGILRFRAVARGEVDMAFYEAYVGEEPRRLRITSRHLTNLLELPLLFYVACTVAYLTGQSGALVVFLAWAYALLRVVHTVVHLGPNVVLWRFRVFALSVLTLMVLWLVLLTGLLTR